MRTVLSCFSRDLLQTLNEEELVTLERNLCISQDWEFSTGQGLATSTAPAPVQENQSSCSPANGTPPGDSKGEQENVAPFVCPSQEEELVEVERGWEKVESERGEEDQEQVLLCEEAEEAELACSMQYDEEELEQLNMMVYRVGDEMSTLLSPPSQGHSPAHNPHRGVSGSSSGASSTEASPRRLLGGRGRTGIYVEEEDKVFFMDDLDASGDGITSISRESCLASSSKASDPACPVQHKPGLQSDPARNGWHSEAQSEQPCPQPHSQNTHCPSTKRPPCTSVPSAESLPYTNGWEMGLEGTASETAEVIAHRMGGMKLSATVIFNPRSPSLTELTVDKLLLPRPTPSEIEPCGPLVATHCLLNSCVCCGSCEDGHEDAITMETSGLGLGLALGLDKQGKTPPSSTVIQSSACRLPPRGHELHSKAEPMPPASRCSAEPPVEEGSAQLCEKCLVVAPGPRHQAQDCSSNGGRASPLCNHQARTGKRQQASGGRQRDMERDKPGKKDSDKDSKEDSRKTSRWAIICMSHQPFDYFGDNKKNSGAHMHSTQSSIDILICLIFYFTIFHHKFYVFLFLSSIVFYTALHLMLPQLFCVLCHFLFVFCLCFF